MKNLFRVLFYPVVVFGALVLHLSLAGPGDVPLQIVNLCVALSVMAAASIGEMLMPYKKEWIKNQGDLGTDFILTNVVFPVLTRVCLIGTTLALLPLSQWLERSMGHSLWPADWPILPQLLLALLVAELFFYWIHRFSHNNELLWSFHAVHHGANRVYWVNSARFHPLDASLQLVIYLMPLAILGAPERLIALFLSVNVATGFLEHANVDFRAGFLNYFFNSAELHRWHHSSEEKISKNNFGKVLCIWDLVFGTHYYKPGKKVASVGLGRSRKAVPVKLIPQLLYPFRGR